MKIGAEYYPFSQYYAERGTTVRDNLEEVIMTIARAGLELYEPFAPATDEELEELSVLLRKHGVAVETAYVNVRLHDPSILEQQIDSAVAKAARAKALGARIVVTNPEPIRWGGPDDKNDTQLRLQAGALRELGDRMKALGIRLGYHTHDPEMRQGAREFHHMLQSVPHDSMCLYLDSHWVFRGCGDSAVAVEDIVKIYAPRIEALHLRQSIDGVWTEHLRDGDIDYAWIAKHLKRHGFNGPLILETAFEKGTPRDLPLAESLRRSADYARRLFG